MITADGALAHAPIRAPSIPKSGLELCNVAEHACRSVIRLKSLGLKTVRVQRLAASFGVTHYILVHDRMNGLCEAELKATWLTVSNGMCNPRKGVQSHPGYFTQVGRKKGNGW